jgi:hypothetical protein
MSLTTLEERHMPFLGDIVFDSCAILFSSIAVSSFFPGAHSALFFSLILIFAIKYHHIIRTGRHPAYSMINKAVISSHKNVLAFQWPSIISISALSVVVSFLEPFNPAAKGDSFIVLDSSEWIVSTNGLQCYFAFRFAVLVAIKFGFIKVAIQTKEM